MWYRMMAIAFLANGLCAFGARVLQDLGLAETHSFLYLAFWYLAGLAVSLLAFLGQSDRPAASAAFAVLESNSSGDTGQAPPTSRALAGPVAQISSVAGLTPSEVLIGGLMGIFSSVGWIFLTRAIASGLPGYLAFPIAIGGNLSIVAVVGVLIFKERLSLYGYFGMLSGITGIALLATV